jgi:predicted transcriptional regulator
MLKQEVINTITSLPENVTIEDIMYRLYILDKHRKSLADIDAGRIYSTEEIRKSIIKNSCIL